MQIAANLTSKSLSLSLHCISLSSRPTVGISDKLLKLRLFVILVYVYTSPWVDTRFLSQLASSIYNGILYIPPDIFPLHQLSASLALQVKGPGTPDVERLRHQPT